MCSLPESNSCSYADRAHNLKKRDANHWEKGDHSGARFDLCTVYGHIHQQKRSLSVEEVKYAKEKLCDFGRYFMGDHGLLVPVSTLSDILEKEKWIEF